MEVHLFGATTSSGFAFKQLILQSLPSVRTISYSRSLHNDDAESKFIDLSRPFDFVPSTSENQVWICFAPIWHFATFIDWIHTHCPEYLLGIRGIIACSSSSAITKRYASNFFDRDLASRLFVSEELLISVCDHTQIPCKILRPSLIYGRVGPYVDHNLNRLLSLMRKFPLLPIPP